MPLALRALLSFLALPFTMAAIVPALILSSSSYAPITANPRTIAGLAILSLGSALLVWTVGIFFKLGRGTLAPWDPPKNFVVRGPYRHWRHPMISGVNLILIGEALIFGSVSLLLWQLGFLAANLIYLPLKEEPDLVARFGEPYRAYMRAVPRWLPRATPYRPEAM